MLSGGLALSLMGLAAINAAEQASADTGSQFISQISDSAVRISRDNDLYPSVTIAQALHESAAGTSGLGAAPYYNLFGIKGQSASGGYVTMTTWEDDGYGNAYVIDDQFRAYNSWAESLDDYASLLSWDYYDGVHKTHAPTYQDATAYLTGRYATDTSYNHKLNEIIETYNLTQYDYYQPIYQNLVWNKYRGRMTDEYTFNLDWNWSVYNGWE